jgi:uncharacterized phage protein (TIGR01671 family)
MHGLSRRQKNQGNQGGAEMREIRFRGKTINLYKWAQKGDWVYGGIVLNANDAISCITENPFTGDMESIEVDSGSVGQCTGLQDVRGDPIYEGDIIRIEDEDSSTHINAVVCFGEYTKYDTGWFIHFGNELNNKNKTIFNDSQYLNRSLRHELNFWLKDDECCIIGNIYDNPELLNGDTND